MTILTDYNLIVFMLSLGLLSTYLVNIIAYQSPKAIISSDGDDTLPLISILVPARNEERNIEACVRSLLAVNYPKFELIVLDDNSTDRTYEILCKLREQDHRLQVLAGTALPEGWYGKPHACWQLAQAATGDFMLLTDADCTFSPDSLLMALGASQLHDADMVSMVPRLVTDSFWESLIIPLMYFVIMAFLPIPLIRASKYPIFAAANGAFIFLRRDSYFEVDGHRAVRTELAEDVKFAQHWKREGKSLWYGDGSKVYSVRMYHGFAEVWSGFSKNMFSAFSRNLPLFIFALVFVSCTQVLPAVLAVIGFCLHTPWRFLAAGSYLISVTIRLASSFKFDADNPLNASLSPLAWAVAVGIGANSAILGCSKGGTFWKGRFYGPN